MLLYYLDSGPLKLHVFTSLFILQLVFLIAVKDTEH